MPESLYFLSFWAFTYFALSINKEHRVLHWLILGMLFGITALIKPHALFLLPVLAIYFFIVQRQHIEGKLRASLSIKYVAFFVSSIATKLIIGFILAGSHGVTLFGSYTSYASGAIEDPNRYISLVKLALANLQGHLLALVILFSMPIAHILLTSKYFVRRSSGQGISINIALYTMLVLAVLLIVVAFFTASVSGMAVHATNARLHMRYYDFALPLLFLIATSQLSLNSISTTIRSRALVALPIGASILYAAYTYLAPYTPILMDSPELRGFTYNPNVFYALSGVSIFSLALWVYAARAGAKVFVYLFMPLAVGLSTYYANLELRERLVSEVFDKAGIFAKQYLPTEELSKLVIVGSDEVGMYRSLFYVDNPKATFETIPMGAAYDSSKLPAGKEWILVIGDHPLPENMFYQLPLNGFTLARVTGTSIVDFKMSVWPGVLASARGLYPAEQWGTWSSSKVVSLEFYKPLPKKFTVHLVASAFGPNVGKEIMAHVGDNAVRFTLGALPEERVLEFNNPKSSKIITIDVPSPISPYELGFNEDGRAIGIAFTELRIEPL